MKPIQWLMVNGPFSGRTFNIAQGSSVRLAHENGEEYLYAGENYLHDGRLYRIGICHSEPDAGMSQVPRLIRDVGLRHIAGS